MVLFCDVTLYHTILTQQSLKNRALEHIVGKGENAGNNKLGEMGTTLITHSVYDGMFFAISYALVTHWILL